MKARYLIGLLIFCLPAFAFAVSETEEMSEEDQYIAWASEIWNSLNRQSGTIEISEAGAVLRVPESFYYLNPADSEKILAEVWGNPTGQFTLGTLFPVDMTPFEDNSRAVTIEYEEDGYVSDEDADETDYGDLLSQMKEDTRASNEERVQQGYETIELIGWAAPPYYDSNEKKLHWAKEYKFGSEAANTLNYNIRVLGRKGVLVLNFIAAMDQKAVIEAKQSFCVRSSIWRLPRRWRSSQ
ncbi:MAG: DUF2167 domain-containing protein [Gammaproteobacteria bacterium]|nr:DUF2167 domain-containing protein [Gammaproteobacteria bacterium]